MNSVLCAEKYDKMCTGILNYEIELLYVEQGGNYIWIE